MNSSLDKDIYAQLRHEFITEARDGIEFIETALDNITSNIVPGKSSLEAVRRQVHTIKGLAEPFGFPFLTKLAHQLEDYLMHKNDLDSAGARVIQEYCDIIGECLRLQEDPSGESQKDILKSLFNPKSIKPQAVAEDMMRSLIITSSKTVYRKISSVIIPIGFQTSDIKSATKGIEHAALNKPGLVIVSDILDGLKGVDVVNALVAMPATQYIPVIFMTSFDKNHPDVKNLPPKVPIIYLGADIKGEILRALTSTEARFAHLRKNCA